MNRALVLVALAAAAPAATASDCTRTTTGLVPLTQVASYHGYRGGLYPGGRNTPSARYLRQALAAAARVQPVDGKIVLLSIGMSNTTAEFQVFKRLADTDARKNAALTLVDGAVGGADALRIQDPASPYWQQVDARLGRAGATAAQVQAVWLKEAIAGENHPFPQDAQRLRDALRRIVADLAAKFPNLRLVYASSRIYAGYASTPLNPEPAAYDSGFAVKWLVGDRIDGHIGGPIVLWGPYLWADGTTARRDGLTWACSDLRQDGTHPSETGAQKVARMLLDFFSRDRSARGWFLRRP